VSIDYEEVNGSQRSRFTDFIKELSQALHARNKFVGVALHPKVGEASDNRYEFQDWEALSSYADSLYIMSYGEHYDEGEAGPIASLPWVEDIISYTESLNVAVNKFSLGIPLYGYDWEEDEDAADGLVYTDVMALVADHEAEPVWDSEAASPYFHYDEDGDDHEVWFENAKSATEKIELAKKSGFGGITFWRLGGEDRDTWRELNMIGIPAN
jgi:spore germination protein YaaH